MNNMPSHLLQVFHLHVDNGKVPNNLNKYKFMFI